MGIVLSTMFYLCVLDGTNLAAIYYKDVVKAELFEKCDYCCPVYPINGVVVTLEDGSRWLIHNPICNYDKWQIIAVQASCMNSDWKLLSERRIKKSQVRDYMKAGNISLTGSGASDYSHSRKKMMELQ